MTKKLSENKEKLTPKDFIGGCGRSCTCDALANYLLEKDPLIIDLDPQANIHYKLNI